MPQAKRERGRLPRKRKWIPRGGFVSSQRHADLVGAEIEWLEERAVAVTTDRVLARARKVDHPLHPYLEKNAKRALVKWQKHQVRNWLNSVIEIDLVKHKPVKAEYNLEIVDTGQEYVRHDLVARNGGMQDQLGQDWYSQMLLICTNAENIGLTKRKPKWADLVRFIKSHSPY